MIVVVAEKPSVARDLAAVLGATQRHEGYLEGGGYQVTWALGHLVELGNPDAPGADSEVTTTESAHRHGELLDRFGQPPGLEPGTDRREHEDRGGQSDHEQP